MAGELLRAACTAIVTALGSEALHPELRGPDFFPVGRFSPELFGVAHTGSRCAVTFCRPQDAGAVHLEFLSDTGTCNIGKTGESWPPQGDGYPVPDRRPEMFEIFLSPQGETMLSNALGSGTGQWMLVVSGADAGGNLGSPLVLHEVDRAAFFQNASDLVERTDDLFVFAAAPDLTLPAVILLDETDLGALSNRLHQIRAVGFAPSDASVIAISDDGTIIQTAGAAVYVDSGGASSVLSSTSFTETRLPQALASLGCLALKSGFTLGPRLISLAYRADKDLRPIVLDTCKEAS
ncbi:MAG: hypothetical protein KDK08_22395 [Rhizobiaceae bacterium]|nr:hypothetical protein [Rhizobiaceae bacterium]